MGLGDDSRALDTDTQMPGADPGARATTSAPSSARTRQTAASVPPARSEDLQGLGEQLEDARFAMESAKAPRRMNNPFETVVRLHARPTLPPHRATSRHRFAQRKQKCERQRTLRPIILRSGRARLPRDTPHQAEPKTGVRRDGYAAGVA